MEDMNKNYRDKKTNNKDKANKKEIKYIITNNKRALTISGIVAFLSLLPLL